MTDDAPPEPEREHDRIAALMADVVEGTATPEVHADVKAHVATCATCREELAELRKLREAFKSVPPQPAPAHLGKAVEETIHRRSAGRFFGKKTLGAQLEDLEAAELRIDDPVVADGHAGGLGR